MVGPMPARTAPATLPSAAIAPADMPFAEHATTNVTIGAAARDPSVSEFGIVPVRRSVYAATAAVAIAIPVVIPMLVIVVSLSSVARSRRAVDGLVAHDDRRPTVGVVLDLARRD